MDSAIDIGLQLVGSAFLLRSKHLFLKDGKHGWTTGAIGISLITPYVIVHGLWTTCIYHIALIILLGYGYFLETDYAKKFSETTEQIVNVVFILFSIAVCAFFTMQTFIKNDFLISQFFQSLFGLIGALFMVFVSFRYYGWLCFIPAHIFAIYVVMHNHGEWIAPFQLVSIGYAIKGMQKEKKKLKNI